jgi:predicted nucleic acid-binding protein
MFLVDTSVWVDFLRATDTPQVRVLRQLLDDEAVVGIAPVILQEILQGADSQQRFDKLYRYFSELWIYVPKHPVESHVSAARMYHACRRAGKTPRSSNDCLIAQVAIEHALILLHNDKDFDVIAGVEDTLRLYR